MKGLNEDQKKYALVNSERFSWRELARSMGVAKSTLSDFLRKNTKEIPVKSPKILILHIETSPLIAMTWGRFKQFISQEQLIAESSMLIYSAKWLGESTALVNAVDPATPGDDREMTQEIRDLMDEADFIIWHNGDKFDKVYINTRIEFHQIKQPSPYKSIDTLKIAKKNMRFSSNSLDAIAAYFGLERKKEHEGFSLWKRVMAGEKEAIENMLEYNLQDVIVLEQVYLRLRHWDTVGPNTAVFNGENCCPACGSKKLNETDKFYYTTISKYPLTSCGDCGKFVRSRLNVLDRTNVGIGV